MATIQPINLAGVKAQLEPIPDGKYELVVIEATIGEVQNGDNAGAPMLGIQLRPYKEFHPQYATRAIFDNVPVVPPDEDAGKRGTFWRLRGWGEAIGMSEDQLAKFDLQQFCQMAKGKRVQGTVGHREWEGENRNSVKNIKPSTGMSPGTATAQASVAAGISAGGPTPKKLG